jgi:DNA-binding PadR family transcriptional regulator
MSTPSRAASFVPLPELSFQILLALGRGKAHGYAIGKEIEARTEGRLNPTTGSLYQALRRLREGGLIAETEAPRVDDAGDARRRYFTLTSLGREVMAREVGRLEGLIAVARQRSLAPKGA